MHDISSFDYDDFSSQEILDILLIQEEIDSELDAFISEHY